MSETLEIQGFPTFKINRNYPFKTKKEEKEVYLKISIEEHMQKYLSRGMDKKEAMKQVAKDRGISKREVYAQVNIL